MNQLRYFIQKELLLLSRDLHGLLLLFVMPAIFILIMTFALQSQYDDKSDITIEYYLVNHDGGPLSQELVEALTQSDNFQQLPPLIDEKAMRADVALDHAKFLIIIEDDFEQLLTDVETTVQLESAPATTPMLSRIMESRLINEISRLYLQESLATLMIESGDDTNPLDEVDGNDFINTLSLYGDGQQRPSSVQQNVPAWLLFAMFFIAIPISTTLIGERQQGTLARLRTMGVAHHTLLLGKLIPYLFINLLQVLTMLLLGIYLVPALGGEQLIMGGSLSGLAIISGCASLAAVSYGLLIAQLANTTEQATIFAGVSNIIMAAIGGVMVPRFLMPEVMQDLSVLSPMAWGLDGFFDILLRSGSIYDVLPEAGALLSFALVLLTLSVLLSTRRSL